MVRSPPVKFCGRVKNIYIYVRIAFSIRLILIMNGNDRNGVTGSSGNGGVRRSSRFGLGKWIDN
jgi:hypothetical protein